jgi:hypothetical protein
MGVWGLKPPTPHSLYPSQTYSVRLPPMKNLTAAICLTIAVLLGSAGVGQVRGLWRLGINPWKENNAR